MVMVGMVSTANSKRLCLLLSLVPTLVWAGDWKFTSGVSLSERYSDNVNLAASGLEQSDWITEITPRLSVRRDSARLKVNVDYSLQGLLYAQGTSSSTVNQNLNALANAELVKEWFYLDTNARISQVLASMGAGTTPGDAVGIGNTNTVSSYTLSPYLKHRFGSTATVEARISRDEVFTNASGISDAATMRYKLSAVSGNSFFPLSWSTNYAKTETDNTVGGNTGSTIASANARYQFSPKFGVLAQADAENYDFVNVTGGLQNYSSYGVGAFYTPSRRISMDALYNTSTNGDFWSGTLTLNPTVRTSIVAASTRRAYGRSNSLNLTHRTRLSNWSLRYQDDLTTSQQQSLNPLGTLYFYNCPTGPEPYVPGVQPSSSACIVQTVPLFNSVLVNQTYLSKTLGGTISYTLRRSTLMLNVFDTRRNFEGVGGGDDMTRGLQGSWSLRLTPRTTYTLTGGMSHMESTTSNLQGDLWNIGLVATHQFMPKVTGSLEARHQERKSNQSTGDFSEDSVSARMNLTF